MWTRTVPPSVLVKHGYTESDLPVGVILATCELVNCFKVIADEGASAVLDAGHAVSGNEYKFDDFSEGRFARELVNAHVLEEPILAKGKLNLWEYPFTEIAGQIN
ncbi:hypothetical protein [Aneurinibacillus sp. Ricciae_BoGa-3]|uniref:hypothetical protein n=1 Tax=Aneurinibacillus sp. Ricciae_BoGa-3 TaxID=3022697 RepID=UPI002FEDFC07